MINYFKPKTGVGINIGSGTLSWSQLTKKNKNYILEQEELQKWEMDEEHDLNSPWFFKQLGELLTHIHEQLSGRYYNLNIALPDPIVLYKKLILKELPRSPSSVQDLILWNISNNYHLSPSEYLSSWTSKKLKNKEILVVGSAVNKSLMTKLQNTIKNSGLLVNRIESNFSYLFNYLYDELASEAGAMIVLRDDCWTVCIWNSIKCIEHVSSYWRDTHTSGEMEIEEITKEIGRILLSYESTNYAEAIENVYTFGNKQEKDVLDNLLKKQLVNDSTIGILKSRNTNIINEDIKFERHAVAFTL